MPPIQPPAKPRSRLACPLAHVARGRPMARYAAAVRVPDRAGRDVDHGGTDGQLFSGRVERTHAALARAKCGRSITARCCCRSKWRAATLAHHAADRRARRLRARTQQDAAARASSKSFWCCRSRCPVSLPRSRCWSVYGGFTMFRMSMAFIVVGHVVFTLPFMVRAVAAVCASTDLRTLEEGAASLGATLLAALRDDRAAECAARHRRRRAGGADAVDRRIQPHVDAAYARYQDAAGRTRRHLRVAAHRNRQRVHDSVLHHDDAAARRDAMARRRCDRPAQRARKTQAQRCHPRPYKSHTTTTP